MAAAEPRRRFPVVLTLAAAIAFAILCGLGAWQFQRMQWKRALIERIEAARTAEPLPIAEALRRARAGEDMAWTRVRADCQMPDPADRQALLYALRDGKIAWRALAVCRLSEAPYGAIVVDRGYSTRDAEVIEPTAVRYPPLQRVVGVLRGPEPDHRFQATQPYEPTTDGGLVLRQRGATEMALLATGDGAPLHLVAEAETPAAPGLEPAPMSANIANRHLEYVITWFGLALALAAVYVAMLMKRLKR